MDVATVMIQPYLVYVDLALDCIASRWNLTSFTSIAGLGGGWANDVYNLVYDGEI
jgi:hypothetical protein